MSNWFVLDKNDNIFADVEEENEARELAITYVTDPWTEDAAPFKVMSYDEYAKTNLVSEKFGVSKKIG